MKIIITIIVSIIFMFEAKSQSDLIRFTRFSILKTNDPIVSFRYLSRKGLVLAEMGNPSSITRLNWQTLTENVDKYLYNGNSIYIDVDHSNVWGFEIVNTDLFIYYNTKTFKVGDDISELKRQFPLSSSVLDGTISLDITTDNNIKIDGTYLIFYYDKTTNKITKIELSASWD